MFFMIWIVIKIKFNSIFKRLLHLFCLTLLYFIWDLSIGLIVVSVLTVIFTSMEEEWLEAFLQVYCQYTPIILPLFCEFCSVLEPWLLWKLAECVHSQKKIASRPRPSECIHSIIPHQYMYVNSLFIDAKYWLLEQWGDACCHLANIL